MSLANIWIITKKELRHYFNSVFAYVLVALFLVLTGSILILNLFSADEVSLRPLLGWFLMPMLFIIFISAFAMRLVSEEKRLGTLELLVTLPLRDAEIIVGKLLGGVLFLLVVLVLMLIYPVIIATLGPLDWGPVIGAYVGLFLLGTSIIAIGLFTSSLTDSQIVAFVLGASISMVLYWVGKFLAVLPISLQNIIGFLGFDQHFNNISKGVIDSRDIIYYFTLIFFFAYVSMQSLVNRKQ
jgi:ABC-2 type transport system permease protein